MAALTSKFATMSRQPTTRSELTTSAMRQTRRGEASLRPDWRFRSADRKAGNPIVAYSTFDDLTDLT